MRSSICTNTETKQRTRIPVKMGFIFHREIRRIAIGKQAFSKRRELLR